MGSRESTGQVTPLPLGFLVRPSLPSALGCCMRQALVPPALGSPISTQVSILSTGPALSLAGSQLHTDIFRRFAEEERVSQQEWVSWWGVKAAYQSILGYR